MELSDGYRRAFAPGIEEECIPTLLALTSFPLASTSTSTSPRLGLQPSSSSSSTSPFLSRPSTSTTKLSPVLQSLLSSTPPSRSYLLSSPTATLLELSHSPHLVTLRTPTCLQLQLSFPTNPVRHALVARFPSITTSNPLSNPKRSVPPDKDDLYSPFKTPPPSVWSDLPLPLPTEPLPHNSSHKVQHVLVPHLVVLHQGSGIAYPHFMMDDDATSKGKQRQPCFPSTTFDLPNPPHHAWPLDVGILLEHQDGTKSWLYDSRAAPSPILKDGDDGRASFEKDDKVAFVAGGGGGLNGGEPKMIVTLRQGKLRIWAYEAVEGLESTDLAVRLIWEGEGAGKEVECELFDTRGEGSATLAVRFKQEKEGEVFLVDLWTSVAGLSATPRPPLSVSALSTGTVLCTRASLKIPDLVILTREAVIILPTAASEPILLPHPAHTTIPTSISTPSPPTSQFLLHYPSTSTNPHLASTKTRLIIDVSPPPEWADIQLWQLVSHSLSLDSFNDARRIGIDRFLTSRFRDVVEHHQRRSRLQAGLQPNLPPAYAELLLALHSLCEEDRLVTCGDFATDRAELVVRLSAKLGLSGWVDHYRRQRGISLPPPLESETFSEIVTSSLPTTPPSTLASLNTYHLLHTSSSAPKSTFLPPPAPSLSKRLHAIYHSRTPLSISEQGFTTSTVEELKWGVRMPVREVLRLSMGEGGGGKVEVDRLLGRKDLVELNKVVTAGLGVGEGGGKEGKRKRIKRVGVDLKPMSIEWICQLGKEGKLPVETEDVTRAEGNEDGSAVVNPPTRFNEDRRLEEVERMLQYTEPVTIAAADRTLDQLTPQVQQNILSSLSNRTLALPIGYSLFRYHSESTTGTSSTLPARVNTSARILPMPSPVALIEKEPRESSTSTSNDRTEWPDFHAGVAAALQLPEGKGEFDASQLAFARPTEPEARHSGFLMGLGLNGRLSALGFNQAFDYLKAKHDPTSIGLLLGLAVAYLGTGDVKVMSLLSVHLAALHPIGSSPLNVTGMVQASALVGVGLLHLGSGKRSLADTMVRELCSVTVTRIEDPAACREAYALSAGFSFGLIMVGEGKKVPHGEVRLLRTFKALVLGEMTHPVPGSAPAKEAPDVHITSPAATIALGLMYLQSEREDVAAILEVPDTFRRLDYVRADLLLLRTLSRCMIMWDTVQSSKAWVEGHVPKFITEALAKAAAPNSKHVDPDLDIARWNIVAGACFGMGLKFAGTAMAEAHATLIHYMDRLTRAAYAKAPTVHSKTKRNAIRACLSAVSVALAMVMAGTGEINALRRLRVAHGHFSEGVTYGTHLASHMALGLLFVGGGQYTLGTSKSSIAALVVAFYPSFPSGPADNRAHLQAYRHLWVLAVEPRCLKVRDVDTNEPTFLPLKLKLIDKSGELRSKSLIAPSLIPELKLVHSVMVDSPRYWPITLDLTKNPKHREAILRDATLYVKRRTGHLSYAHDPRGIRSIFTRSKSETGSSVFDYGETAKMLSPSAVGLRDFVSSFTDDVEATAAVAYLCHPGMGVGRASPPTAFEAFNASVLLECLTKDKRDAISLYQSLFYAHSLLQQPVITPEALAELDHLEFALEFYGGKLWKTMFGKPKTKAAAASSSQTSRPEPLIQSALITHTKRKLADLGDNLLERPDVAAAIRAYLRESDWPEDVNIGCALAVYLRTQSAPDLVTLEELRTLAREVVAGGQLDDAAVALVVHSAGKAFDSGWTRRFAEVATEAWLQ